MIEQSFIILEKIGLRTEQKLWQLGIRNWNDFLNAAMLPGIGNQRKTYYDRMLLRAKHALNSYDSSYFNGLLPKSETWRLYDFFKSDAVFLDIETSDKYTDITVLSLFDGLRSMTMVKHINLDVKKLKQHLKRYKLIVTFNGLAFDSVVLERYYPGILPRVPHFDLRFACAKLGLTGGLKLIEKKLGIKRQPLVADMCGNEAVGLWHAYRATGKPNYLQKLIAYNEEDACNLKLIADKLYDKLKNLYLNWQTTH